MVMLKAVLAGALTAVAMAVDVAGSSSSVFVLCLPYLSALVSVVVFVSLPLSLSPSDSFFHHHSQIN
jgi:hypothetical protein